MVTSPTDPAASIEPSFDSEIPPRDHESSLRPFEPGTLTFPVRGEEIVLDKEAVVTAEVVITKERTLEPKTIVETVRLQRVNVIEE